MKQNQSCLNGLYDELEEVQSMTEQEVCEKYNADAKSEIVEIIMDEIATLERELEEELCEFEEPYGGYKDTCFSCSYSSPLYADYH